MRSINQLVHSRTRVESRYALMPLEGFPTSRLPTWPEAEIKVLASPALGAQFVQMLIDLPAGKTGEFVAEPMLETFFFVLSGGGLFTCSDGATLSLISGAFGLTPAGSGARFVAESTLKLLILRKRYESAPGVAPFQGVYGNERQVAKNIWADNHEALLQTLIPDDLSFDLAMNLFTFSPGHGLPVIETHVMEHGLLFLEGRGIYYLGDTWMEVEKDDFIWMAPFCPQSFYATGPTVSRYIYYKNVNRAIGV